MTALEHIQTAMERVNLLAVGATPKASEQTKYRLLLNSMLGNWEAEGLGGMTLTVASLTRTKVVTAITRFAAIGTDNAYPAGWDEAIGWNLAVRIAAAAGVQDSATLKFVTDMAAQTKAAISAA